MQNNYFFEFGIFFIGSIIVSFIINKMILKLSKNLGIRNKNDVSQRWSKISKPSLGGISLFFTFILVTLFYGLFYAESNIFSDIEFIGLIAASVLAFVMGASDDYYNTKPILKLLAQISCGLILVFTENGIQISNYFYLDALITVFWVVAVMNSLNMLDNMDGITGTVSFFILFTCVIAFLMISNPENEWLMFLIVAEMGALFGFLMFNIHPSKMFMGDTGSQFLALFVSFFGIKALWNFPVECSSTIPSWSGMFLILIAFAPAIVDTLTVIINRTKRGVSVALGGKDHTTHHLVYSGLNDFKVWLVFTMISAFSFSYAVFIGYLIKNGYYLYSFTGILFFLIIFIPLYINTLKHPGH